MYAFRQRPLTWLFLIATVCVDALLTIVRPSMLPRNSEHIYVGLMLGQFWIAGAWLIVGSAHRLARGAAFMLTVLLLTTLISMSEGDSPEISAPEWGHIIAIGSMIAGASALGAGAATLLSILRRRRGLSPTEMRFPVIELFGWTIVVAVASWAMSAANYDRLADHSSTLFAIIGAIVAGSAAALAIPGRAGGSTTRRVLSALIVVVFLSTYASLGDVPATDLYHGTYWAYAYLTLAVVVHHLDRRMGCRTPTRSQAPASPENAVSAVSVDEND